MGLRFKGKVCNGNTGLGHMEEVITEVLEETTHKEGVKY